MQVKCTPKYQIGAKTGCQGGKKTISEGCEAHVRRLDAKSHLEEAKTEGELSPGQERGFGAQINSELVDLKANRQLLK